MTAPKRAAYIVGGLPVPFNVAWVEPDLLVIHARGRASDGDDDEARRRRRRRRRRREGGARQFGMGDNVTTTSVLTSCYAAEPSACALQSGQRSERCSHLGVESRRIRTLPLGSGRLRRSSPKCRAGPTRSLAYQAAGVASCCTAKAALPTGGAAVSRRPCGSYAHTPACRRPGSGGVVPEWSSRGIGDFGPTSQLHRRRRPLGPGRRSGSPRVRSAARSLDS